MENWKRTFGIIWSGQFVSILTSSIVGYAVIFWMSLETGSAEVLALAAIAGMLPQSLLGPVVGVYIDRWDRKRTMILADSFIALDHMFQCLIRVIDGLQLYPARMMANLNKTRGLIFSSKVLLALVDTGITREDAYAIVQENAMATWHEVQDCVSGPTFKERLEAYPRCTVSQEKLDEIFDPWDFLTRIDTVFDRLEQLSFE